MGNKGSLLNIMPIIHVIHSVIQEAEDLFEHFPSNTVCLLLIVHVVDYPDYC